MTDTEILNFLDQLTKRDAGNGTYHQADIHFHLNRVTIHVRFYANQKVISGEGKTVREAIADVERMIMKEPVP